VRYLLILSYMKLEGNDLYYTIYSFYCCNDPYIFVDEHVE
jgi:hypothetical protein